MAYLDDWTAVDPEDRRRLQQQCEICVHMRYMHGKAREVRIYGFRGIEYEAGKCENCPCVEFRAEPLLTKDDVLDLADKLGGVTHLSDLGISQLSCNAVITRWTGAGSLVLPCQLLGGHTGDHSV